MRLAISNIAWDTAEDELIAALLQRYKINAIDIAPGKYFPRPAEATNKEVLKVKEWWSNNGIEITGMQALLFGTNGLNIFGSSASKIPVLMHLKAICRIGGILGATRLVFGSPKNRDRRNLDDSTVKEQATDFFKRLGDIALSEGVFICLEPNPSCYGANFMTNTAETARIVNEIDHPAIRMQLDTGAMTINDENPIEVISQYAKLIGHVHASEPNLVPLGDGLANHRAVNLMLSKHLPDAIVSIEMLATTRESHMASIERAIQVAIHNYGKQPMEQNP